MELASEISVSIKVLQKVGFQDVLQTNTSSIKNNFVSFFGELICWVPLKGNNYFLSHHLRGSKGFKAFLLTLLPYPLAVWALQESGSNLRLSKFSTETRGVFLSLTRFVPVPVHSGW